MKPKTEKSDTSQVKRFEAENAKGHPHRLALTNASTGGKKETKQPK